MVVRPARTEATPAAAETIIAIAAFVHAIAALLVVAAIHLTLRRAAARNESRQARIARFFLIAARLIALRGLLRLMLGLILRLLMLRPLLDVLTRLLLPALKIRLLLPALKIWLLLRLLVAIRIVAVVVIFVAAALHVGTLERLVLLMRILLNELRLRRHDHAEVVLGVLQISFGGDGVA